MEFPVEKLCLFQTTFKGKTVAQRDLVAGVIGHDTFDDEAAHAAFFNVLTHHPLQRPGDDTLPL